MHLKSLFLGGCLLLASLAKSQMKPDTANTGKEIIFASDTQAPMWVETLWLKSSHNRTATKKIFSDIQQQQPSHVFILGDVVNLGYSNRQWKPIDRYLKSLRGEGVKVDAILGNHEVMGLAGVGQQKFQKRFPDHVRTGYVKVVDSVAVVLLNSNFRALSAEEDARQIHWFKNTLDSLDADSSVKFVIAGCHHSPFTNSKIVGPSVPVQQKFVPAFLASRKSKLFLSGHCHGFEHYRVQGKDFLVIGGGGGLHQPLKECSKDMPDICEAYKPLFHYLSIRRNGDELEVTSRELKKDFSQFDDGMSFSIRDANASLKDVARHGGSN